MIWARVSLQSREVLDRKMMVFPCRFSPVFTDTISDGKI